jgi:hypothetical protein
VVSVLWAVGAIAVMIAMYWFAYRMEPHWVSKDGTRFLTTGQFIERHGHQASHKLEMRGTFLDDGQVLVSRRRLMRSEPAVYRVTAKSPDPPKGKAVYLLEQVPQAADGSMLMLRMPAGSRAVARMDAARDAPAPAPAPPDDAHA